MSDQCGCYKCGKKTDLRPYGPRGEMVCFQCAFATPADKAYTEKAFASQLDAAAVAGNGAVVIGSEVGPYPYKTNEQEDGRNG